MCNISATADTTGIVGNTGSAKLEVSEEFYPIVQVSLAIENSDSILIRT